MKKFAFRLQRVMDAKESEKREKERIYGIAVQEVKAAEAVLHKHLSELEQSKRARKEMQNGGRSIGEMIIHDRWKSHLQKEIRKQEGEIQRLELIAEQKRKELTEVSRDKRVLEKLKDKKIEEHRQEELSEQQKFLDEIGSRDV